MRLALLTSLIAFGIAGGSKPQQLPEKGFDMETKLASPKKLAVAILTLFTLLVCLSLSVQPDHEDQGVSEVAPFFVAPVPHTILQKFQVSRT